MGHLIKSISNCTASQCETQLREEFRSISASIELSAIKTGNEPGWASELKRYRPDRHQQFFEVVTQLATVERLLDCLRWVNSRESGFLQPWVKTCHPTTSSSRDAFDNDLVLGARDGHQVYARFECSDIISPRNNNGKLTHDADSLFRKQSAREQLFIVTSFEGAEALGKIQKLAGSWRLRGEPSAQTRIIEITKAA